MLTSTLVVVCTCVDTTHNYSNGVRVETVDLDCRCLCCKTSYATHQHAAATTTILADSTTAAQRKRSSLLRGTKASTAASAAVHDATTDSTGITSNDENVQPVNSSNSITKSRAKCPSCETCSGPQELFFNPTEDNVTEALLQQSSHSRTNSKSSSSGIIKSKACCSCECSSCHCANSSNSALRKGQYIRL
jgi:hypothetical protein